MKMVSLIGGLYGFIHNQLTKREHLTSKERMESLTYLTSVCIPSSAHVVHPSVDAQISDSLFLFGSYNLKLVFFWLWLFRVFISRL